MPLLLLHGAIGSSAQLIPLQKELVKSGFDARLFDFTGHGGKPLPANPFGIPLFATDVINWMNENNISTIDVFGYSMGGYVGMYIAKHYPDRIRRILTVATKLEWNTPTAEKEVKMLDPKKIAEKVPRFAEVLKQRHSPADWETVLGKTAEMMMAMGSHPPLSDEDFKQITNKIQLCVGDRDSMVSIGETNHVYRLLPDASLHVIPNTPHPVEQMDVKVLAHIAVSFFNASE